MNCNHKKEGNHKLKKNGYGAIFTYTLQYNYGNFFKFCVCIYITGMFIVTIRPQCSCLFQCCFFLLERYMKFVDKTAFVQTALFGYSFTKGSQEPFFLIHQSESRMSNGIEAGYCYRYLCCITPFDSRIVSKGTLFLFLSTER